MEVSVFGPGVGECIVVHLGNGEWAVIDSCRERLTRRPVALSYFQRLAVQLSSVRLIVASHWHDDHIDGISEIFKECNQAEFVFSAVLRKDEALNYVAYQLPVTGAYSSGMEEMQKVLKIVRQRAPGGVRKISAAPRWAMEGKELYRRTGTPDVVIRAMSPSDSAFGLALHEVLGTLPERGSPVRRYVSQGPNQVSVVLWVRVGELAALLGADLEQSPNPLLGWTAVVNSGTPNNGKAHVFKVPHHGSNNADNADVWKHMLLPSPHAVLTPFSKSRIPKDSDLTRITGRTGNFFCTAPNRSWSPPNRGGAVDKMADLVAKNRRAIEGQMGHVRVRCRPGETPSVKLQHGAFRVEGRSPSTR
jgi:hypothetical protein